MKYVSYFVLNLLSSVSFSDWRERRTFHGFVVLKKKLSLFLVFHLQTHFWLKMNLSASCSFLWPLNMPMMVGLRCYFLLSIKPGGQLVEPAVLVWLDSASWHSGRREEVVLSHGAPDTLTDLCSRLWHSLICQSRKFKRFNAEIHGRRNKVQTLCQIYFNTEQMKQIPHGLGVFSHLRTFGVNFLNSNSREQFLETNTAFLHDFVFHLVSVNITSGLLEQSMTLHELVIQTSNLLTPLIVRGHFNC